MFAMSFFFILAGLLTAYGHCLAELEPSGRRSGVTNVDESDHRSHAEVIDCHGELSYYRLAWKSNSPRVNLATKVSLDGARFADRGILCSLRSTGIFPGGANPLSFHSSIPIYQANVVYRI